MVGQRIWRPIFLILLQVLLATCLKKSSLTFVIDDTESIRQFINTIRSISTQIIDKTLASRGTLIEDIVVATFNDPGAKLWAKTKNRTVAVKALNSIYPHTTKRMNPCPEDSMGGILLGLNNSLPGSIVYVFTDSDAQDKHLEPSVIEECQRTRSVVTFLLTDTDCMAFRSRLDIYKRIANACSGKVLYATPDQLHEVIDGVNIPENEMSVPKLVLSTEEKYVKVGKYEFTIDKQYEYIAVTLVGKPDDANVYFGDQKLEPRKALTFLNSRELQFNRPQIGNYTMEVLEHLDIMITVSGKIEFTFEYGFSQQEPKTIIKTSKQPIKDTNNYLSILTSGTADAVSVEDAEILNMEDEPIKQIPLYNKGGNFYTSAPFELPSPPFKIAVNGVLKDSGRGFTRITEVL